MPVGIGIGVGIELDGGVSCGHSTGLQSRVEARA